MKAVRLKTLLSTPIKNGYSPICVEELTGKWVLGLGALDGKGLNIGGIKAVPVENKKVNAYFLREGDFLVSRSNTLDKIGRAAVFRGEIENCAYPDLMMRFRINEEKVNVNFLDEYLRSEMVRAHFRRCAAGTSGSMVKITKEVLEKLEIILPAINEQKKIANILKTWEYAIQKTEALIAAKEKQFKWLRANLLMNCEAEVYKLEELEKLKLVTLGRGNVISRKTMTDKQGANPIYSSSIKNKGLFGCYGDYMFDEELVTWSIDGGGNFFYRPKHKFSVTNVCGFMRVDQQKIDCRFLAEQLMELHEKLVFDYQFKAHPSVIRKIYRLKIPALNEQRRIAEIINAANHEVELLKLISEQYRTQKHGLMQKLLTGEWRVSTKEGKECQTS